MFFIGLLLTLCNNIYLEYHLQNCMSGIPNLTMYTDLGFYNWLCCVRWYTYFFWHTHDFGHVYVDAYAHFFPMIFLSFQNFSSSHNFILFKNFLQHV